MQKIFEPILHILYLSIILLMGSYMIRNSIGNKLLKMYGTLALILGFGDGIYLIPRIYSILTTGIEENLTLMGWGRMGSTIAITLFFLVLYDVYNERYSKKTNLALNRTFYGLAIIRIIISILPGNKWFQLNPVSTYALLRLIPLIAMGKLLLLIIYIHSKKYNDLHFKIVSIVTFISIIFMEPRAFISDGSTGIVIFTVIRTIALTIIVFIGYKESRDLNILSRY